MSDRLKPHLEGSAVADICLKNSGKRSCRRQSLFDSCSLNGRMEFNPARRPTIQLKRCGYTESQASKRPVVTGKHGVVLPRLGVPSVASHQHPLGAIAPAFSPGSFNSRYY